MANRSRVKVILRCVLLLVIVAVAGYGLNAVLRSVFVFEFVINEHNAAEYIAQGSRYSIEKRRELARQIAKSEFGEVVLIDIARLVPPLDDSGESLDESTSSLDAFANSNMVVLIVLIEEIPSINTPEGLRVVKSYVNDSREGTFSIHRGNFLVGRARGYVITKPIGLRAQQLLERSEVARNGGRAP
jgi:hypothetical protein